MKTKGLAVDMRLVIGHGDSGEQLIGELFGMPERFEPARGYVQPVSGLYGYWRALSARLA